MRTHASPLLCRFSEPLKRPVHSFAFPSAFPGVTTSVAFTGIGETTGRASSLEGLGSLTASPGVVKISTVTEARKERDSGSETGSETRGEVGETRGSESWETTD